MQSGSLVVYIGGLSVWDIEAGCYLDPDVIYQVDQVGRPQTDDIILYEQVKDKKMLSLIERPGEIYLVTMFREVMPPDEINLESLMDECVVKKEQPHITKVNQN
jgi:hypothetical protein